MNNVNIIIVGMNTIGVHVSKEFSRFLSCLSQEKNKVNFYLVDDKKVKAADLKCPPFCSRDIGYYRASVMRQVIVDNLNRYEGNSNVAVNLDDRVFACTGLSGKHIFKTLNSYYGSYGSDSGIHIIVNCTESKKFYSQIENIFNGNNKNILVMNCCDNGIEISFRTSNTIVKPMPIYKERVLNPNRTIGYNICSYLVNFLIYEKMPIEFIEVEKENYDKSFEIDKRDEVGIICVGAGGTGGNFIKEVAPILLKRKKLQLLIIDGDKVEEKNRERQPFGADAIQQKKSKVLKEGLLDMYPSLENRIVSYDEYLDTVEDLYNAISLFPKKPKKIILVGAVDNHRARQVLHDFYIIKDNVVYMDSANEFDFGEIVIGAKLDGKECSKPRAFYFPDVLTDNSPSVSEQSCGVVNVSSPQHQVTNLVAADILVSNVEMLLEKDAYSSGIVFFDTFTYKRNHCVAR